MRWRFHKFQIMHFSVFEWPFDMESKLYVYMFPRFLYPINNIIFRLAFSIFHKYIIKKKHFFIRWNKTYFSAHPFSSPSWLPLKGQSFYYGNSVCYPFSLSHLYNIVNHSCGCLWKVNNFITFIKFLNLKYLAKETFNYD